MSEITLVSVNIERSKHLGQVIPFLKGRAPEVTAIQECMERDVPLLQETLQAECAYTPLCMFTGRSDEEGGVYGQAIFSRLPIHVTSSEHYGGEKEPLKIFHDKDTLEDIVRVARVLTSVEVEKEGSRFRIATTHFTWSPHGEVTPLQRQDLAALLPILEKLGEVVLTGDFNAPRGRGTWNTIAGKYKDNIPLKYTSSIDGAFHRAGNLPYVVDGLFTTPEYVASNVELHSGLSDHMAVTATISKL